MLSLLAVPSVFAQQRYIADNLFTYMHAGPSNEFRIIGSVNAGDTVQLLTSNKDSGYSQILDPKGRKGWVETRFVTRTESIATRLPKIEEELTTVKAQLTKAQNLADQEQAGLLESLDRRDAKITEMESNYASISSKLTQAQTEVRELRAKLDTQKEDLLLKYFMYGGGVAGAGLLFGLVLPHLIPRRKKKQNGWA
jgi:SH3 domain protein